MKRWFLVGFAVGVAMPIVGGGFLFRWWQHTDRIAWGVRVQGVALGGLRGEDAKRVLAQAFSPDRFASIAVPILWRGRIVQQVRLGDLGVQADVERTVQDALHIGRRPQSRMSLRELWQGWREGISLPMAWRWEEAKLRRLLQQLAPQLEHPPQRAYLEWEKGTVRLIPHHDGVRIAVAETLKRWRQALAQGQWKALPIEADPWHPEVTTEDLAAIDGVVGQATTSFRVSERNRSHNIRLAAARLDHVLIRPGETFSFNEIVGPRSPRYGFQKARVLVRGQFTQDFGGGVCQVASTLYLAALRAGMAVVQRHCHSRPIGYLPPGFDATVNFGSLDLKLRNPFPEPLYIRTFVKGGRLTVLILGKKQPNLTYRLIRSVRTFGAVREKVVSDSSLPPRARKVADKGTVGYQVTVWRWHIVNGTVVKKERISTDTYAPRPRVVLIGASNNNAPKPQPSLPPTPAPLTPTSGE